MIDNEKVGRTTMRLLDRLEEQYDGEAELIQFVCVAEIRYPDEDVANGRQVTVQWEYEESTPPQVVGALVYTVRALLG